MGIEKTPYDTWRVRWTDGAGKQRAKSFKRKRDAETFQRDKLAELGRGVYAPAGDDRTTVAAWADQWLAGARNLGAGGRETYRRDLDRYILPELGDFQLRRLTPASIDDFLTDELERLAPSTVHRHYRTIRRMCQVAVVGDRLVRNPCDAVTPPRIEHEEMRFLNVDQVDALADAITDRYRAWVYVAAYGGLRWSETVGLRRRDVDGRRITVAGQLIRRADGRWHRDVPKTKAGRRVVTLPAFVADELATHLEAFAQPGRDGLVFVNREHSPLSPSSWRSQVFKRAVRRAGLDPKLRPHDLRHTAAALAIATGAHPKAISARLGHSSVMVTLDRYGHLFPEMDERIADRLDELGRPPATS